MNDFLDPDPPEEELDAYCEELSLEDEIYDPADDLPELGDDFDDASALRDAGWGTDEDYGYCEPTWDAVSNHDSNEGW